MLVLGRAALGVTTQALDFVPRAHQHSTGRHTAAFPNSNATPSIDPGARPIFVLLGHDLLLSCQHVPPDRRSQWNVICITQAPVMAHADAFSTDRHAVRNDTRQLAQGDHSAIVWSRLCTASGDGPPNLKPAFTTRSLFFGAGATKSNQMRRRLQLLPVLLDLTRHVHSTTSLRSGQTEHLGLTET